MNEAASRYAKALFLLAKTDFREELKSFVAILQKNPSIHRFFNSPHIPLKAKSQVLEKGKLDPTLMTFLNLLLKNSRFGELPEIVKEYSHLVREKLGIEESFLKSALPLSEEQYQTLKSKLEQYTGKKMELEVAVDPKLLGGGVLKMNNHLLDFSVKGKLARLKEELLK